MSLPNRRLERTGSTPAAQSGRSGAPGKPARCEGVKVSDSEGLANHTGPESCVVVGDGCGEALTGERAGRVLSPEIKVLAGCRRAPNTRKATRFAPVGRGVDRPGGVGDPWHARKHLVRDPGGAPPLALGCGCPRSARRTQKGTAVMHDGGESDSSIVPVKQPNNMEAWTIMGGYGAPYTGTQVNAGDSQG